MTLAKPHLKRGFSPLSTIASALCVCVCTAIKLSEWWETKQHVNNNFLHLSHLLRLCDVIILNPQKPAAFHITASSFYFLPVTSSTTGSRLMWPFTLISAE